MLCKHDEKYGTFGATNGCVACEAERQAERARDLEKQLVWLGDWCQKRYGQNTNALIGYREPGVPQWPHTVVEVVARVVEEAERARQTAP